MAEEKQSDVVYATLAGTITDITVQKLLANIGIALAQKVKTIHLMLHTGGGSIGDGIAIHNFIKAVPLEIIIYNCGWVQSIGVVAFLGAKKRKASKTATFMIHRPHYTHAIQTSSRQLQGITESLAIYDVIIEGILRDKISMPEEKWDVHKYSDLFITAEQALEYGIIDEITDFTPPIGATLFNVMGQ